MTNSAFGSFGFRFLDSIQPPVARLVGVGHEHRTAGYDWDNRGRDADAYLFQYTLAGAGAVSLGGGERLVERGQGFLLPLPGNSRYYLPAGQADGWQFLWVILSGSAVRAYCRRILGQHGSVLALPPHAPAITHLNALYQQALRGRIQSCYVAEELAFQFICRLAASLEQPGGGTSTHVAQARQLIEQRYAQLQSVAELARCLGISAEHLSRSFSRETGGTVMEALTRRRLRQAVQLLREPSLSIEQVALQCGFSCGNYFGKVFRHALGVSPSAFRRDAVAQNYSDVLVQ